MQLDARRTPLALVLERTVGARDVPSAAGRALRELERSGRSARSLERL